jgi:serine/threonine protein phosphatase PrpC
MNAEYFETTELSDVGKKRKNNEDASLQMATHGIFCIADGMGGQAGGGIASKTIISTLQEVFSKTSPEEDSTLPKRIAVFRAATNRASKWIKDFSDEKVVGPMGSTIVALVIDPHDPRHAVCLHAGDSRLYRYRNGELKQVTTDHSGISALVGKSEIPIEKVPAKYQNELLRAVGLAESVELEKNSVDICSGDVLLICSDGLPKALPNEAIAKIIKDSLQSGIQTMAQTLINSAQDANGRDNVTVILVKALDFSRAPRLTKLDDDQAPGAPEMPAMTSPEMSVPASDTSRRPDSDILGDTPKTPASKDSRN